MPTHFGDVPPTAHSGHGRRSGFQGPRGLSVDFERSTPAPSGYLGGGWLRRDARPALGAQFRLEPVAGGYQVSSPESDSRRTSTSSGFVSQSGTRRADGRSKRR